MEDLLPGLIKMMEERLGRFGRPLSTLVVLAAALGIIAWGFHQVWVKIITPVVRVVYTNNDVPISQEVAESGPALWGWSSGTYWLNISFPGNVRKYAGVRQRRQATT